MNMINEKLICENHVEMDRRTWYAIRHKNRCGDLAHKSGSNFDKMASYKGCECAKENSTEILDLDKFIKENKMVPSYEDLNPLSRYMIGKEYRDFEERPPIDIVNEDIMDMKFEDFRRMLGFCRFYFKHKYKISAQWFTGYFMLAPKLIKNYDEIAKEDAIEQINHIAWFVRNFEPCMYKKVSLMNDNITYNSKERKPENYESIENDKKLKLMVDYHGKSMYYQMNVRQFIHFLCTTKVPTNTLKMHVVGVMIVKVMQKLLSEIDDEDERYQEILNAVNTIIEKKRINMLDPSRKNVFRDWIVDYAKEYEAKKPDIEVKITELIAKLRRR